MIHFILAYSGVIRALRHDARRGQTGWRRRALGAPEVVEAAVAAEVVRAVFIRGDCRCCRDRNTDRTETLLLRHRHKVQTVASLATSAGDATTHHYRATRRGRWRWACG